MYKLCLCLALALVVGAATIYCNEEQSVAKLGWILTKNFGPVVGLGVIAGIARVKIFGGEKMGTVGLVFLYTVVGPCVLEWLNFALSRVSFIPKYENGSVLTSRTDWWLDPLGLLLCAYILRVCPGPGYCYLLYLILFIAVPLVIEVFPNFFRSILLGLYCLLNLFMEIFHLSGSYVQGGKLYLFGEERVDYKFTMRMLSIIPDKGKKSDIQRIRCAVLAAVNFYTIVYAILCLLYKPTGYRSLFADGYYTVPAAKTESQGEKAEPKDQKAEPKESSEKSQNSKETENPKDEKTENKQPKDTAAKGSTEEQKPQGTSSSSEPAKPPPTSLPARTPTDAEKKIEKYENPAGDINEHTTIDAMPTSYLTAFLLAAISTILLF